MTKGLMTVLSQSQSQSQNPINVVYHLYRMAQAIQSPQPHSDRPHLYTFCTNPEPFYATMDCPCRVDGGFFVA